MKVVVLGAAVLLAPILLAGCVQQAYVPPPPIELQSYPPVTYETLPSYRAPTTAPLAEPLPIPAPLDEPPTAATPDPNDNTGAIPLQQMPAPAPEEPAPRDASTMPTLTTPAPAQPQTPIAGPGSNVPLEGFRPMHSQTRPTP